MVTGAFVMSSSAALAATISTAPPADGWVEVDGIYAPKDDRSNNTITISGGTVKAAFAGGYADGSDDASGNKINIGAGTFKDDIFGAYVYNGDATGNTVDITDGEFYGDILGGCSYAGNVTENMVNITDGTFEGVLGGYSETADVAKNTVTITDGDFGAVFGGNSYSGKATGNTVNITDGTFNAVVSGSSEDADAADNIVTITKGTFNGPVYGGESVHGKATGNTVDITDGEFGAVFGGSSEDADATGNTVTIAKGTFDVVYGGQSYAGNATENIVNITDGTFGAVFGGSSEEADAADNTVTIQNGTFGEVFGGYSEEADATGNTVTITNGEFNDVVFGGHSYGDATENTVDITAGTFNEAVYGGYSENADTAENTVTIKAGAFYGDVYGGNACIDAAENTVDITDGMFDGDVHGGFSYEGDATKNAVDITAGTVHGAVFGGNSDYGNASENTVTITDGEFGEVFGGHSFEGNAAENTVTIAGGTFGNIAGGYSSVGDVMGNAVTISGGTFDGDICGGFAGKTGNAADNTVTISGTADLENAQLFGGAKLYKVGKPGASTNVQFEIGGAYGGSSAPNTLNIGTSQYSWANLHNTSSNNIKTIQGFDVINFEHVKWDTENPALKVDGLGLSDEGTTITVKNLYVEEGDATFTANANMTLIDSSATNGVLADDSSVVTINSGIANVYEADIVRGPEDIYIVLGDENTKHENVGEGTYPSDSDEGGNEGGNTPNIPTPSRNDQVLVLGESRAAAMAFTNQGSELIELAINDLARDKEEEKVFAAVYGNHSEYETGSHVDVNGWSGIVGIAKTTDTGLTYGAFFENGIGDYSTHNIYTDDYIRGDGEAVYNGGGFLVRKDNANGVYTEASVRAGNLSNELDGAVRNGQSLTGYDIDTFYYGAHIGVGKLIPKGNDSLDVYGKFIYTHHNGETFDIDGTDVEFDSMDSQRLRLGLRYNSAQTKKATLYYGAAWEYEFDGDANDKVATFDLETPSLEGSTVIGELGLHYIADARWSFDVNARGYTGQRDGVSGSVHVKYRF